MNAHLFDVQLDGRHVVKAESASVVGAMRLNSRWASRTTLVRVDQLCAQSFCHVPDEFRERVSVCVYVCVRVSMHVCVTNNVCARAGGEFSRFGRRNVAPLDDCSARPRCLARLSRLRVQCVCACARSVL